MNEQNKQSVGDATRETTVRVMAGLFNIDTNNSVLMGNLYAAYDKGLKTGGHWSDCAMYNEPAYPNGPCDCGADAPKS